MRLLHILAASAFLLMPKLVSANHIPEYEQQLFIETWANIAVDHMRQYGIPASITLAQAIVESGWGKGTVAVKGNNFFCIKSNNGWLGPIVKAQDDEVDSSSFRSYTTVEESFEDHAKFLQQNIRYRTLFSLSPRDYKAWSYGLKSCGYATKEDYAEQLIATIERYGLHLYDRAILDSEIIPSTMPANSSGIVVDTGGTEIPVQQLDIPTRQPLEENRQLPRDNWGAAMPAPRYRLGNDSNESYVHGSATEETSSIGNNYKISLIMPKVPLSFKRR